MPIDPSSDPHRSRDLRQHPRQCRTPPHTADARAPGTTGRPRTRYQRPMATAPPRAVEMTLRLKWILLIGGVAIITALAVKRWYYPYGIVVNAAPSHGAAIPEALLSHRIQLPPGFAINVFASGTSGARMLRFTSTG